MFKRRKTLALSATVAGVFAAWALAWGVDGSEGNKVSEDGRHWGRQHGSRLDRMARHLDLTDEQRSRIETIMTQARSEAESLRGEMSSLREDVGEMIRSDNFFEDQVRIEVESRAPVFVELTLLGIRTMHDVYQVLTPEQRVQAEAMMAHGRGRMRGFGPGFGGF